MKKILLILTLIIITICLINKSSLVIVPNESIRFRIIASSNDVKDIEVKNKVANNIKEKLIKLYDPSSITSSRKSINNNLNEIDLEVKNTLNNLNYTSSYDINYGINYFPEKVYKGVKYNEGYYESLVVTIGKGEGNNYWCVLFPPLCMVDETENIDDIEYKFLINEIIQSIKNKK